jgi:hypothetical protein
MSINLSLKKPADPMCINPDLPASDMAIRSKAVQTLRSFSHRGLNIHIPVCWSEAAQSLFDCSIMSIRPECQGSEAEVLLRYYHHQEHGRQYSR